MIPTFFQVVTHTQGRKIIYVNWKKTKLLFGNIRNTLKQLHDIQTCMTHILKVFPAAFM